jgi:hypothetical protein
MSCCVVSFVLVFLPSSFFSIDEFTTPTKLVNRRPQRTPTRTPTTATNFDANNDLGDKVVCYLPGGLVFFLIWIDSKLDERIMQVKVTEDGMGVLRRKKKPCPNSGGQMIDSMYKWAGDGSNFVVKQLDDEINRLKEEVMTNAGEWKEEVICQLREECLTDFVDIRGNPSGMVQYKQDSMGRQLIGFFLKTANSQKKVAKAAVFESKSRASSTSERMDDFDDDEETVMTQDYKDEMELKMIQQQERFSTAMKQQQQQMDQTAALLSQLMGQMQVTNQQQQQAAEQRAAQQQQDHQHQLQLQQQAAEYAQQQLLAKQHYDQQEPAGPQPDKPGSL